MTTFTLRRLAMLCFFAASTLMPALAQHSGEVPIEPGPNGRVQLLLNGHPPQIPPRPGTKPAEPAPASGTIAVTPPSAMPDASIAVHREVRYMTEAEWAAFQAAAAERARQTGPN